MARPEHPHYDFPLKASGNGRYLEDNKGTPFLLHADTGWRLINKLKKENAAAYLKDRKDKGFTAVVLHIVSTEFEGESNAYGNMPFADGFPFERFSEPYWQYVDELLNLCEEMNLYVLLSACWFDYAGVGWRKYITISNAAIYGEFLGTRYAGHKNILWILGGDDNPGDRTDATHVLAAALKKNAPHHLLTYHAHSEFTSADHFDNANWLDVNMAYTYKPSFLQVSEAYRGGLKIRPVVLGETCYELETNTGFFYYARLLRRQAWWAMLSGACGHAVGQKYIYKFNEGWESHLNSESTVNMTVLKNVFSRLHWWDLLPDLERSFVRFGTESLGQAKNSAAALTPSGSLAVIYTFSERTLKLNTALLSKDAKACLVDPVSGERKSIEAARKDGGISEYDITGRNASGDCDWALIFNVDPF